MQLVLKKRRHETGDVYSFFFKPTEPVKWRAGQYLNLTMPGVAPVFADRLFTIASGPHESTIQITTLMGSSPFKQKLDSLKIGDRVNADQLGGDFLYDIPVHVVSTLPPELAKNPKRLFVAGGIGVTPYISIIRDKLHKKEPINATLLYAGRADRRPFVAELETAAQQDPTFIVKQYDAVRLTLEQLTCDFQDINEWVVYLAGSQRFSEALGEGLVKAGHPRNQIKYDYFDGYIDIEY